MDGCLQPSYLLAVRKLISSTHFKSTASKRSSDIIWLGYMRDDGENTTFARDNVTNEIPHVISVTLGFRRLSMSLEIIIDIILMVQSRNLQ